MENNKTKWVVTMLLLILGFSVSAIAYEGGTKLIATMIQPERGQTAVGPVFIGADYHQGATKLIAEWLNRLPAPTLSAQRIREEKRGVSLDTKMVVLFQRG